MNQSMDSKLLKMGDLTRLAGVSDQTVRHYERLGLVQSVGRTQGGYRLFSEDTLRRIQFIREAQGVGFSLDTIRSLLLAKSKEDPGCQVALRKQAERMEEVGRKLRELERQRIVLLGLEQHCQVCQGACTLEQGLHEVALRVSPRT